MSSSRSEATREPGTPASNDSTTRAAKRSLLRGPGWAAATAALNRSESFLAKVQARLTAAIRRPPEPEPEPAPRETPANLRFSDLDLDDPEHALRALHRASRVPPHRRHIDGSPEG
jgi:hypothetical protein